MKRILWLLSVICLLCSCNKEYELEGTKYLPPTFEYLKVSNVTSNSAIVTGKIASYAYLSDVSIKVGFSEYSDGLDTYYHYSDGYTYSSSGPTVSDIELNSDGTFSCQLSNLTVSHQYFVRAFAIQKDLTNDSYRIQTVKSEINGFVTQSLEVQITNFSVSTNTYECKFDVEIGNNYYYINNVHTYILLSKGESELPKMIELYSYYSGEGRYKICAEQYLTDLEYNTDYYISPVFEYQLHESLAVEGKSECVIGKQITIRTGSK